MAKRAKKREKTDIRAKIVESALDLAAKRGWSEVSMAAIAKKSGVSPAALSEHFDDKTDILIHFGRMIDRRTLARVSPPDPETPMKERLFDVMMERFEILNAYRRGLVSVMDDCLSDPLQAVIGLPYACRSMSRMLEAAGAETAGIQGAARVFSLTVIYVKCLRAWKEDESADLAKTMAALDKALSRAERLATMCGL